MSLRRLKSPGERPRAIRIERYDQWESPALPSILRLCDMTSRSHCGTQDLNMRAASAQMIAQRFEHLVLGGVRRAHQQRLGGHDHAVEAIAALRGLLPNEGVLHRIGMLARAEAFERHDVAPDAATDRDDTGA